MNIRKIGTGPVQIVWAHGWGMDSSAFLPFAESMGALATSWLPDLPGHGQSPPPPAAWGTGDYASVMAAWLETLPKGAKRIWVGHSFGCRVGLQLAAGHKGVFDALVLVGAAGLKRRRPAWQKIWYAAKVRTFKALKVLVPEGPARDRLRARFGSADYARTSGVMREVLIRTVNEDLSVQASGITCPVLIVCGNRDTETPPELSYRLHGLIKGSQLHILDGYDHYTILGAARHQVMALIKSFMDAL